MQLKKPLELIDNKRGFTLTEIIIAAGILGVFITGLISLFSGGSSASNKNIWLASISNQLKLTSRQVSNSIKASSYPSCLRYPNSIVENKADIYGTHFFNGLLMAEDADSGGDYQGSIFLSLTEAKPAKLGYTDSKPMAELFYHVFALSNTGILTYSKYSEEIDGASVSTMTTSSIPSNASKSNPGMRSVLARDVESVECFTVGSSDKSPISVRVTCKMPRSNTSRTEVGIGSPNVKIIPHSSLGDLNR
jgi:prepilin-type N-terminal cleavage/methylation domain-containing protein